MKERLLLSMAALVVACVGCTEPAASSTAVATTAATATPEPTPTSTPRLTSTATSTPTATPTVTPTPALTTAIDCAETVEYFLSKVPSHFESVEEGIAWCQECLRNNGIPRLSPDIGPFCNALTSDAGTVCTDSSQCEGICIAEDEDAEAGRCTEIERVLGCVLEMTDGKPLGICFD